MKSFVFIVSVIFLFSCGNEEKPKKQEIEWNQEKSTKMNKELAIEEEILINLFLEHHKEWKMEKTGSGLQYYIYEHGEGEEASVGLKAQVEMNVSLLDGTECYKTNADEYEEFLIDRSEIESGVQEGIKKMKVGDKAKFIIPFHLAHGLVGDMDKIPPLTTIVVDIHLIGLTQ